MNELIRKCCDTLPKTVLILLFCMGLGTFAYAQQDEQTLFTVDGTPVKVSEFTYIYSKTNGKNADFSRKSLDEYLDLYVKFKLKVRKAKEMRLDTIKQLQEELAGYRKQLADSYLLDKTVKKDLAKEVYDRKKEDIDISHVLIGVKREALPADTLAAYEKAMAVKKRLESGENFETVAKAASDDKSAQKNGGRIGFVTAMFPRGLYNLETAAYNGKKKKILGPIRTDAGYHVLRVNDRRPAYGEVEIAHILVRSNPDQPEAPKQKIDSLYKLLQQGTSFETLASSDSEDSQTAAKQGYIGFMGINRFATVFEQAAFGIKEDGGYSAPFQSNLGWHIIKRISRPDIQPFDMERSRLEAAIVKDSRLEQAKAEMLERIKKESKYRENQGVYNTFVESLNDTFLNFRWKPNVANSQDVLFTLDKTFQPTIKDFTDYLVRASRDRLRKARSGDVKAVARAMYEDFVNEQVLKYEESQLEIKNPNFKALMREYEEGILLFEATKMLVWDKASQDTSGLQKFYEDIVGKYKWRERAKTIIYRISQQYQDQIDAIHAFAKGHTVDQVKAEFNKDGTIIVNAEEKLLEKGRNPELNKVAWEVGALSPLVVNDRNKVVTFYKLLELIPPSNKTLREARGYIVADYQDHLEREWIKQLKTEYPIDINTEVFESLIKD